MKRICPCDSDGICPYDAQYSNDCEYWCAEEPEEEDFPDEYLEEIDEDESHFN